MIVPSPCSQLLSVLKSSSALERVLCRTVDRHGTPVSLVSCSAGVTDGRGLPWLIEGLEVEDIETPVEHAANGLGEVGSGVGSAGFGSAVAGSA